MDERQRQGESSGSECEAFGNEYRPRSTTSTQDRYRVEGRLEEDLLAKRSGTSYSGLALSRRVLGLTRWQGLRAGLLYGRFRASCTMSSNPSSPCRASDMMTRRRENGERRRSDEGGNETRGDDGRI